MHTSDTKTFMQIHYSFSGFSQRWNPFWNHWTQWRYDIKTSPLRNTKFSHKIIKHNERECEKPQLWNPGAFIKWTIVHSPRTSEATLSRSYVFWSSYIRRWLNSPVSPKSRFAFFLRGKDQRSLRKKILHMLTWILWEYCSISRTPLRSIVPINYEPRLVNISWYVQNFLPRFEAAFSYYQLL